MSTVPGTWAVRTPIASLRMSSLLATDARVNENGPSSRHLEVMDAQLSVVSAPAVGPLEGVPSGGTALGNYGRGRDRMQKKAS
jgi:hypothetical protein